MQDLKVIGVENGAIVAVGDDGERFRIAVDETLQSRIRQVRQQASAEAPKLSPREVQAHIRAGMSAEDVSAVTGAPLEYVQRFEGPIIAEREHIVASALSVPVHTAVEVDPLGEPDTFGSVIRDRLASLGVAGERWASWKDSETGWIVKLEFTADAIDHDARWSYDARKHALAPINSEATTLSQAGELRGGALIPRLRAVLPHEGEPDTSRFDSGAFTFPEPPADLLGPEITQPLEPLHGRASANNAIAVSAINRADDDTPRGTQHTADLLEALRRRRGEREAASYDDQPAEPPAPSVPEQRTEPLTPLPFRLVEESITFIEETPAQAPTRTPAASTPAASTPAGPADDAPSGSSNTGPAPSSRKKGRAAMPSWDEIVFGARTDDDLA
ncbi:septation protein SepH [Leifsonia sp. F6_8S_P_1B]|uniref:Septation protein SepH n=1 Tax=Leifsonia williamsii TaxID=3035919 RepID=A0ABT8KDM9_9MICO|nr:septation protein SepH [Leifsonia williamsii]MDN4615550.1 septation protein SepH [Leifsonia williamsii]